MEKLVWADSSADPVHIGTVPLHRAPDQHRLGRRRTMFQEPFGQPQEGGPGHRRTPTGSLERRRSGEEILIPATPGWGCVGGQHRIVPVPGKDGDEVRPVTFSAIRR